MTTCWDYACLAQNGNLLAQCIRDPEANHAQPLPMPEAASLILALTQMDPRQRPGLAEMRSCQFLQQLDLPSPHAPAKEITQWLKTAPRARSLPSEACLSCGGCGCGLCRVAGAGDSSLESLASCRADPHHAYEEVLEPEETHEEPAEPEEEPENLGTVNTQLSPGLIEPMDQDVKLLSAEVRCEVAVHCEDPPDGITDSDFTPEEELPMFTCTDSYQDQERLRTRTVAECQQDEHDATVPVSAPAPAQAQRVWTSGFYASAQASAENIPPVVNGRLVNEAQERKLSLLLARGSAAGSSRRIRSTGIARLRGRHARSPHDGEESMPLCCTDSRVRSFSR